MVNRGKPFLFESIPFIQNTQVKFKFIDISQNWGFRLALQNLVASAYFIRNRLYAQKTIPSICETPYGDITLESTKMRYLIISIFLGGGSLSAFNSGKDLDLKIHAVRYFLRCG